MILSDFYRLNTISKQSLLDKTKIEAEIVLNPTHPIFKGHFPNLPIVPGVCMVQIVKEIAEKHLHQKLFLSSASNIKFLSVLNPEVHQRVNVEVQWMQSIGSEYAIESKLFFDDVTFFKMRANFLTNQ
jgi:3-hydroxyacyl-[acyl-carrier-protein] dehydratase